jgi:glutamyl-tRNA synthetase
MHIMEKAETILFLEALRNAVRYEGKANPKAVLGKLMRDIPEFRAKSKEIQPILDSVMEKVNNWSIEKQTEELLKLDPDALKEEEKKGPEIKVLPDLPNAKIGDKKHPVVMRMAPFPSGALHIGNARMIVLNDEYVKKYKGKLYALMTQSALRKRQSILI